MCTARLLIVSEGGGGGSAAWSAGVVEGFVCHLRGDVSACPMALLEGRPRVNRMTDGCENITFRQLVCHVCRR